MLELPAASTHDHAVLADWIEMSVLLESPPSTSRDTIATLLRDTGFIGADKAEYFQGEDEDAYDATFSDSEAADRFTELLWQELHRRRVALGEGYPFLVGSADIALEHDSWRHVAAYLMLLLLDLGRSYRAVMVDIQADTLESRLFEKIVEASARGLLAGPCSRFGWPREPDWPTGIDDRVARLAQELELSLELLDGKTRPNDKDRGLDVAGRFSIAGSSEGTMVLLAQCAVGKNWKKKRGEPWIADWRDLLQWKGFLVRGVAVPWRLSGAWGITRAYRHFDDALILDRPRILAGAPDRHIDQNTRRDVELWCEPRVHLLPVLN